MAKLYLLREGSGDARVASSFEVQAERIRRFYESASVRSSDRLPTINADNGPANPVSNPQFAVVQMQEGDASFGDFRAPGFNLLYEADCMEVYRRLVDKNT